MATRPQRRLVTRASERCAPSESGVDTVSVFCCAPLQRQPCRASLAVPALQCSSVIQTLQRMTDAPGRTAGLRLDSGQLTPWTRRLCIRARVPIADSWLRPCVLEWSLHAFVSRFVCGAMVAMGVVCALSFVVRTPPVHRAPHSHSLTARPGWLLQRPTRYRVLCFCACMVQPREPRGGYRFSSV